MMIRSLTLLLAVLALALVSSAALPPIRSAEAEDAEDELADEMAQASNAFGRSLYTRLAPQEGNLFLSSYSVHAAMQLVREGARGATATEMDKALGLGDMDRGRGYRDLARALAAPNVHEGFGKDRQLVPAYALNIANAVWAQSGYPMEKPFIDSLAKVYGAPLARVDFKNQSVARKAINDWVARETRERIRDIVPDGMPPPLTRLVLANAIYFKAAWAEPFTVRWTKEEDFTGSDGKKSKAHLMHRVGRYRYAEIDGVQVLELPYRGGHLAMVVYLPASHDGVGALEKKLAQGGLDTEAGRKRRLVDVKLPKFRVTSFFDLTSVLAKLGMSRAFDPRLADFTGMTKEEPLYVGVVLHKAFVAVDEAGTEAAAATVAMMKAGSAPRPEEKVIFRADRPFLFEIRHRKTGAILFAGRVARP